MDRCFDLLAGDPWTTVDITPTTQRLRLEFMLSSPDAVFHEAEWPAPEAGMRYEEFQVVEGERPRRVNPTVARLGYRIVEPAE